MSVSNENEMSFQQQNQMNDIDQLLLKRNLANVDGNYVQQQEDYIIPNQMREVNHEVNQNSSP